MEEILDLLRENARLSAEDISAMTKKSIEEVKAIIKKLEDDGIILKYAAIVNPEKISDCAETRGISTPTDIFAGEFPVRSVFRGVLHTLGGVVPAPTLVYFESSWLFPLRHFTTRSLFCPLRVGCTLERILASVRDFLRPRERCCSRPQ